MSHATILLAANVAACTEKISPTVSFAGSSFQPVAVASRAVGPRDLVSSDQRWFQGSWSGEYRRRASIFKNS